jgi:hypothetical protein
MSRRRNNEPLPTWFTVLYILGILGILALVIAVCVHGPTRKRGSVPQSSPSYIYASKGLTGHNETAMRL